MVFPTLINRPVDVMRQSRYITFVDGRLKTKVQVKYVAANKPCSIIVGHETNKDTLEIWPYEVYTQPIDQLPDGTIKKSNYCINFRYVSAITGINYQILIYFVTHSPGSIMMYIKTLIDKMELRG